METALRKECEQLFRMVSKRERLSNPYLHKMAARIYASLSKIDPEPVQKPVPTSNERIQ